MQFFIILALTATFAGAFAVPANQSRGIGVSDSFESSCKRWKLTQVGGDAWLDAYCKGKGGAQWHSVINLNHCLVNRDGVISSGAEGWFAGSCHDMHLQADTTLDAKCNGPNGENYSEIKLADVLSNDDGQLRCFNARGCAVDGGQCPDQPPRGH